MTNCHQLETFLDGRLEGAPCREFEAHLAACENCRLAIEDWRSAKQTYAHWVERKTRPKDDTGLRPEPSAFVASVLETAAVEKAAPRTSKRSAPRIYYYAAAAAVLFGILGSIYYVAIGTGHPTPYAPVTENLPAEQLSYSAVFITNGVKTEGLVKGGPEDIIEAPKEGRVLASLKDDHLGLDSSAELRVANVGPKRTELLLAHGTAAFEVSPRPADARFVVRAGDISVAVIGTRFSISMDEDNAVIVYVDKGTVSVFSEKWRVELKAGSSITVSGGVASAPTAAGDREMATLTRLLSEDNTQPGDQMDDTAEQPTSTPPTLSTKNVTEEPKKSTSSRRNIEKWRTLIINGEVREAEKEINTHLSATPRDSEALMLLATCQKKQARYIEAVATYKKVSASTDERLANRAYYHAGELSFSKLHDFGGAVKFFESYLKRTPQNAPNRPEARLMHAESLLNAGANVRARTLLNQIVTDYGRTPIANRARALLKQPPDRDKTQE